MRLLVSALLAAALAAGAPSPRQTPTKDAATILGAAREALGGDKALSAVKNFVATGRTRQVRGNNLIPIEFEIVCELPGRYVRIDEIPAQESGPTSSGFDGERLIPYQPPSALPTPPARPDPTQARVNTLKQDFAKLTLGMFATSFASYPLTFTFAGVAEAPQGKADIVDVKGPSDFALRLFINEESHLPIMVSWTTPATNVVVKVPGMPAPENSPPPSPVLVEAPPPPPPTATKEEQAVYAKQLQDLRKEALAKAKPIEHRIYYADYRDIGNGLRFPFRIRRATAGETLEETNFDSFRTNVRIDQRKFQAVRK